MTGEAHLPGEVTNPDEQLYQFVNKNNLALTQHSIRDVLQEVSMEIEISIDARAKNISEINGWIREAIDEQKRLMLKRSQIAHPTNDPFLKSRPAEGDGDEILGPNSFVRIKKSQLDHLLSQIKSN
jgi:hypothetical protein